MKKIQVIIMAVMTLLSAGCSKSDWLEANGERQSSQAENKAPITKPQITIEGSNHKAADNN